MSKPAITRVSSLEVTPSSTNKNNGFYAPQLTTAQITAIPADTLENGAIVYNTSTNIFQTYATYVIAANGVTTSAWLPLGIPVMTAAQGAEFELANNIPGQMYLQTDNGEPLRIRGGAAWRGIATA